MTKEIGVGLVGFGLGGRVFHAPFIRAAEGMVLRGVVSGDPAKVHRSQPGMAVVPDIGALLARSDIDLVIVSSPDAFHAEQAILALRAGKHVLVDKPFATNLADARMVAEAAKSAGRMLTVFQNRRWDADFLTLQRLIAEGRLGRIVHFESHFDRWRPQAADVWKEAREGGSWFDLGPHLVDQAVSLFGRPEAVTADITAMRAGAVSPDWFHVVLHYPARRVILHSSKLAADNGLRFAVHGTGGSWIKHGLDPQEAAIVGGSMPGDEGLGIDHNPGTFTPADDPDRSEPVPSERGDYRKFWHALEQAIRGRGPNPVPPEQALAAMEVLQAGLASAAKGMTVTI